MKLYWLGLMRHILFQIANVEFAVYLATLGQRAFRDWLCFPSAISTADPGTRSPILAGTEKAILKRSFLIPIYDASCATLYFQRIASDSEEYINSLAGRGGLMSMT